MTLDFDLINVPGITYAKLLIKVGSGNDPLNRKGAHQLLGALLSRGCGRYNHIDIANIVETAGAGLRCETNEEGIIISLKCAEEDAETLLPLLSLMINEPIINKNQLKLEKHLTIQALTRQKENPFHLAFDGWRKVTYEGTQYTHDPLGTQSDIEKTNRQDLLLLAKGLQHAEKFLVIGGSSKYKNIERLLSIDSFKAINFGASESQNRNTDLNSTRAKAIKKGHTIYTKSINTEQVILILGQATIPLFHEDNLYLRFLACYLGTGMSSLLFKRFREENGIAYDVGLYYPTRGFKAPFILHASTTENKCLITLRLLMETWIEVKEKIISQENMSLTLAKFRGQIAHSSQTAGQRADRIAHLRSLALPKEYDDICLKKANNIDKEKLQEAARKHLISPILSACGPQHCIDKIMNYWKSSF
tara:strand:+ start:262 stop:1518 length:1257 start_codon:yes stop_codon:yes gene_type:complete